MIRYQDVISYPYDWLPVKRINLSSVFHLFQFISTNAISAVQMVNFEIEVATGTYTPKFKFVVYR